MIESSRVSKSLVLLALAAAGVSLAGSAAFAAPLPNLKVLVTNGVAVGSNAAGTSLSLAAFAYDPGLDRIFATSFANENQQLREITNLDSTPTFSAKVYNSEWQLFDRGGNPNFAGGSPTVNGMVVNSVAVGGQLANSFAVIQDAGATVTSGTGASLVNRYDLTQRLYLYNLGTSTGVASSVFTPLASLADFRAAANYTGTGNNNISRQPVFSSDGQSVYAFDTSTGMGGLYRVSLTAPTGTNAVTRLTVEDGDFNTEAVVRNENGKDAIYVRGGGSTGNTGGIDKIVTDGTVGGTSAKQVVLSAAAVRDFFELPTASITTFSMASDADGNLYFNNTATTDGLWRGIFRLDAQGRLSKVVSYRERQVVMGGTPNANTLRMQIRDVNGVKQLLYAESSPINVIAAARLGAPGDFDFDGFAGGASDIAGFKSALTIRGVAATDANLIYDMNGNGNVDFKDVKILQTFLGFRNGDADLNGTLNLADLATLGVNYLGSAKTWLTGDFTGDDVANLLDLQNLAAAWNLPKPTYAFATDAAFSQTFSSDVIATFGITLPGDYNGDGFVDAADYTVWADHFGNTGTLGSVLLGDGNGDGVVDAADYTVWADHFGLGTPPAGLGSSAVPEPAGLTLAIPATVVLLRRRRA